MTPIGIEFNPTATDKDYNVTLDFRVRFKKALSAATLTDILMFTRSGFTPGMADLKTGVTLQGFTFMDTWQANANAFGTLGPHQPSDKGNKKEAFSNGSKDLLIFTDSNTFQDPLKTVRTLEGILSFTWDKDKNKKGETVYIRPIVQITPAGSPEPGTIALLMALSVAVLSAIIRARGQRAA